MKTFEQLCQELENSENETLKSSWIAAKNESKKANRISIIICLVIDILLVFKTIMPNIIQIFASKSNTIDIVSMSNLMFTIFQALVINIFIFAIVKIVFGKKQNVYKQIYKSEIIKKLMGNFYSNLEYFPDKQMPQYVYNEGKFNESYNRYNSEDYLEAQLNNQCGIQMAEVETKKVETHRDSKGRTRTTTRTIFYGLFAKIVMEKSINSEIRIMHNGKFFLDRDRLEMDSSEFEKYFDVQATNKIHGMQLLTADVMEDLINFQNKTNVKFDITIYNNIIYIRFHCGEMFEPTKISEGLIHKESLEKYFNMLNFTYNLSNKLTKLINETEF